MATKGEVPELFSLIALQDSRPLFSPLGQSKKIKYTSIAASPHYVALGANTGGVYCFHRDGLRYIRILSNKEGTVSLVRFSPDERCLAVVSGGGHVGFWGLNLQELGISKRFHVSSLLKEGSVRAMVWDNKSSRLFYGDDQGRVAVAYTTKLSKKFSSTGSLFKKPDEILYHDKYPIVQMDFYQDVLLVSTHTRCLLMNVQNERVLQVGKRARDGPFGACFHGRWGGHPPVLYSARPGGRLWEADIEGTVVSTLKLKDLISVPATPILGVGFQPDFEAAASVCLTQPLNFSSLSVLTNRYMVGHLSDSLFVFDPASYRIAAWTCDARGIVDVFCSGKQLFVLCEEGRGVAVIGVLPVRVCLQELVRFGHLKQAELLLRAHSANILQLLPGNRPLYETTKTTVEFARSHDQDLPECLQLVESTLRELHEQFKSELSSGRVEADVGTDSDQASSSRRNDPTEKLDSYADQSVGGKEEGEGEGEGEGEEEEEEEEGDIGGLQSELGNTSLQTEETLTEPNASDEQETGLLSIPLDESSHVIENSTHIGSKGVNEEGYLNDVANLDMHVELEEADGINETDAGLLDNETTLIPDDHNSSKDSSEFTTSVMSDVQSPDASQSHMRSLSWDERTKKSSAPDSDQQPMVQNLTGSDFEKSFESSSEAQKLSPYPESVGIEIPQRSVLYPADDARAQSEVPNLQDMSDPSTVKVSHSGPSSLEMHPTRTEPYSGGPLKWRSGADSSPKFRRSISFPTKPTLPLRLTSAIKHSTEDDVIAVPVRSASSGSLREPGSRSRGRKKKQKKSSSPALSARRRSIPEEDLLASMKSPDNAHPATNILNIPEEPPLPFPEAGLPSSPPTHPSLPLSHSPSQHSHHSSATTSRSISPFSTITSSPPKPDSLLSNLNRGSFLSKVKSLTTQIADRIDPPEPHTTTQRTERNSSLKSERLERYPSTGQRSERSSEMFSGLDGEQGEQPARGIQKPTALLSKMKSLKSFAKQGGQSVRIEPETIQRPVKVVKDFLSSLANPQPSPPSQGTRFYDSPYVYRNEGYGYPAESAVTSDLTLTAADVAVEVEEQEYLDEVPVSVQDPRVSEFCTATAGAMHSLVDPQVLSSPDKLRCTLRDWLQKLENLISVLSTLTTRGEEEEQRNREDVTNESDYTSLPQVGEGKGADSQSQIGLQNHPIDEQRQKSNLETKNLGGTQLPGEAIHTPADFFQSKLYLGLEDKKRETVIDLISLCAELGVYCTTVGSGSLQMFVRRYVSVLDVGRMRSLLGTEEWEMRSVCWREVARKCTDVLPEDDKVLQLISSDADSAVDHIATNASTLSDHLPAYLVRLYEAHPMSLVDLSIRCFPYILPWEIAIVCGVNQSDEGIISHESHMDQLMETMTTSATQCHTPGRLLFGNYLSQSLRDEQTKSSMLEILQSDSNLTMLSLEVLLQLGPSKSHLETPDGNPVPWSHMTKWDPSLETLVEVCVAMETQHREAAKLLCAKHGYWMGVVWLSVAMGDGRRALRTALCLRDMRLFTEKQKWGQLLNSLEDWQLLLELMADLRLPVHASRSTHTTSQPPDSTPTSMVVERSSVNESRSSVNTGRYGELKRAPNVAERSQATVGLQLQRTDLQNSQQSQNDIRDSQLQHYNAKYGHDMNGRVDVTWTSVVRLMLSSLSPGAVTQLLSRVDFSSVPGGNGVQEQLHGLLVQLGAVHTQQRAIAHSLLEKVDRYLWSPRPNSLPPHLLNIHTKEKQRDQAEERLQAPVFPSLVEFSSTLEDASSHWGVRSNQGAVCGRCQLSLLRSVSDLQPGIVAFCCGHSFHKHCLPEQACVTCFTENLRKYHTHAHTAPTHK